MNVDLMHEFHPPAATNFAIDESTAADEDGVRRWSLGLV
jgi:hypothetical protein